MIQALVILFCAAAATAKKPLPPRPFVQTRVVHPGYSKIIIGTDANPGQFPYIVSLNDIDFKHSCGASILTPSWLLTAAHCCLIGTIQYVYTSSIFLSSGGLNFEIAEQRPHPEYNATWWQNDLCLVRIIGQIPLDSRAQQVTLAAPGTVLPDKVDVVIAGWGYVAPDNKETPDRLQYVTEYVARSPQICQSISTVPPFHGYICCQGSDGQAICNGDSGSPLTYKGAQVGLASFGHVPCGSGPDFYARVPEYIDWIKQNLGDEASLLKIAAV